MKKILRCLTLIAALCVGWSANAQGLGVYEYSTGIDANKWITLTEYTDVSGTGSGDSWASSVMNIGFSFPFGDNVYTQYSVNSDGNLRLGSTVTGSNNYSTPFSSTAANTNNPKINFFGCDGYLVSDTHYIHSQNFGDTLLVVEYCLGPYSSTYRNNQFHWQVHLYSNGKIEAVFASASNLNSSNSHYMGICVDATDGWIINSSREATHFTNGTTTTYSWSSTTWPAPNTYFTFKIATCPRPSQIVVSNITTSSATFTFSPAGTETAWIGSITDGTTTLSMPLTDTMLTVPMLTPNTEYTVSVRAICGAGDTSMAQTTTFRTRCLALTAADLPYTEDFESYGTGSSNPINPCWTKGTNGSTAYPYPYSSAAINGSRGLYFYGYKPSSATGTQIYSYAALPELAPSLNAASLTLRFNAKRYSITTVYYRSLVQVGVMTDPTDINTFEVVETINLTSLPASTVVDNEVNLSSYTGNGKFIAFCVPPVDTSTSYSYNYIYLDDVELFLTPTCPRPANIVASNITSNSATITITPEGSETTWLGILSDGTTTTTQTFNSPVVNLSMLTPNTDYTITVRAFCTVGDTSEERTTTFHTDCVPLTLADLPYTEDFEAYGSGSTYPISHCWTKGTNSTTAYPYPSSTAAINGSRGLYFYGYKPSSGTPTYSYAALPELASTVDLSGLTLRFNVKRYSTTTVYYRSLLEIGIMTDPTDFTTYQPYGTINLTPLASGAVRNVEIDLGSLFANYSGNGKYITFYVPAVDTSTSYSYNYIYLDDVELLATPTCHRPYPAVAENITNNSATIHWTSYGPTDNNFVVAYGRGSDPSLMTSIEVNDTITTLTGLSEAATYNVFVKTVCSPLDMSEWSIVASFTTHQSPIVVNTANPFFENFENEPAWVTANGSTNKWYIGNAVNNGGENSLYISNNSGVSNTYGTSAVQWSFAQKALSLAAGDYVVNFDWKAYGEGNYDYLRAFLVPSDVVLTGDVSPTGDSPYNFRSVTPAGWISLDGSSKLNLESSWQHRTDTATITTAGNYNLVFLWTNDGSGGTQPPAAVDNVKVQYMPANATTVILANADPTMGYTIPEPGNYYFAAGDTMRATAIPYIGHQFEYWELNAGLIHDSITVNPIAQVVPSYMANMSFNATAHFSPIIYTVTVAANNPLMGSVTGSGSFTYNSVDTLTAIPNSSFRFLRWSDGDTNATRYLTVTSDTTLTAIFDYMPVTVILTNANPTMGTTVPAPGTYTFNVGDTMGALAIANTGYHFDYWTVAALGLTDTITLNPIADVVPAYPAGVTFDITANFAPNVYTITATSANTTMGTVTGGGSYAYGTTATLTATPATGYHFVQWSDADTHATRTITVTGDVTYTATFAPNTYTITVLANNALLGTVTGGGTYTYGATATLTATAATNCHFVQWNDANTSASRTITVTGDATYTATFAYDPLTVTLAVNDTTMGTTNPAPGTYTFNVGDTLTATAIAAAGHSFQTWSIPGVTLPNLTDNPLSVVIPAEVAGMSLNFTAQFAINSYTINVVANDSTRGTVTGSGTYIYGTTVTISATPAQHNYLLQWSDGDTNLTRTITVTHDATYTALFRTLPQHAVTLNATVGGTVTGSGVYYEDDMVTITATPDEYYAFVNWVDVDNNVVYTEPTVTFPMGTANIVLTAVFEQVVFEATLDVTINNIEWGHVLINGERADRYHGHTGDTVTLQAVAHDGYHFDYWEGVHPIEDSEIGETVTIVLAEPATDISCFFAENVGIRDIAEDNTIIYTKHNNIVVSGAEQQTIRVFDVVGRLVAQRSNAAVEETIPMPATGVYLVKVGDRPARRVVVRK